MSSRFTVDTNILRIRDVFAINPQNSQFIQPQQIPMVGQNGKLQWYSSLEFFSTISVPTASSSVLDILLGVPIGLSSMSTAITTSLNTALPSTVLGLSNSGYATENYVGDIVTLLSQVYKYISATTLYDVISHLGDLHWIGNEAGPMALINSNFTSGYGYISTFSLYSTVAGLGSAGYVSSTGVSFQTALTSTVIGLGTSGYVSTAVTPAQLTSSIQGLGLLGYVSTAGSVIGGGISTPFVYTSSVFASTVTAVSMAASSISTYSMTVYGSNTLTVQGGFFTSSLYLQTSPTSYAPITLSSGYLNVGGVIPSTIYSVTPSNIASTVAGLGMSGYVSSSALASTVCTLYGYISSFIDPTELTSTVVGLASAQYVSSSGVQAYVVSTISSLGAIGYVSSSGLASTTSNIVASNIPSTVISLSNCLGQTYLSSFSNVPSISSQQILASSVRGGFISAGTINFTSILSNGVAWTPGGGWTGATSTAVAIGSNAGVGQCNYTIAIGVGAGSTIAAASSIILNAVPSSFNSYAPGFYVNPVRFSTGGTNALSYNTATGEVYASDSIQLNSLAVTSASYLNGQITNQNFVSGSIPSLLIVGGANIFYSYDQKSFFPNLTNPVNSVNAMIFNGTVLITAGTGTTNMSYSSNGTLWFPITHSILTQVNSLAYFYFSAGSANYYLACGSGASSYLMASTDGITSWASINVPITGTSLVGIQYDSGLYYTLDNQGNVYRSFNGGNSTWSPFNTFANVTANALITVNGNTVACLTATGGLGIYCYYNPGSWTPIAPFGSGNYTVKGVAYGAGVYVFCGLGNSVNIAYASAVSGTYTTLQVGTGTINSVTWDGTKFIAVGANGFVATSANGSTWTILYQSGKVLNAAATFSPATTLFANSTSVGVLCNSPSYTLDVNGSMNVASNFNIAGAPFTNYLTSVGFVSTLSKVPLVSTLQLIASTISTGTINFTQIFSNGVAWNPGGWTGATSTAVLIGCNAGLFGIGQSSIAIGVNAGTSSIGIRGIAIGAFAGVSTVSTVADTIAIGTQAGFRNQSNAAIALGFKAGMSNQQIAAVAIGSNAGSSGQNNNAVAIGGGAGSVSQGSNAVAIGAFAGNQNQSTNSIAIGYLAGLITTATSSIVLNASGAALNSSTIGFYVAPLRFSTSSSTPLAGCNVMAYNDVTKEIYQTDVIQVSTVVMNSMIYTSTAIAIGFNSGLSQSGFGISIGSDAGNSSQGSNAVAIGRQAAYSSQESNAVAIGFQAGYTTQKINTVAIGFQAGYIGQSSEGLALGYKSGYCNQSPQAIALGYQAGFSTQGTQAVAIGYLASYENQKSYAIGIGYQAGQSNQSNSAIAIGNSAGQRSQGENAVAIGNTAGLITQESNAIALGYLAGYANQGANSVALGAYAGAYSMAASSIMINATGDLAPTYVAGFHVKPVRPFSNANTITYNTTSGEFTYQAGFSDSNVKENISTARNYLDDLMQIRVVHFNYISSLGDPNKKLLGYIAQEVKEVFPSMVWETGFSTLALDGQAFIPMLVTAAQSLNSTNRSLTQTVSQQAFELSTLNGNYSDLVSKVSTLLG